MYYQIILFVLGNSQELFDLLATFDSIQLQVEDKEKGFDGNTFTFIVHGGAAKLFFPSGYKEYSISNNSLKFSATNYQVCYDRSADLFIVENCSVNKFIDLKKCIGNKVHHTSVNVPKIESRPTGNGRGGL